MKHPSQIAFLMILLLGSAGCITGTGGSEGSQSSSSPASSENPAAPGTTAPSSGQQFTAPSPRDMAGDYKIRPQDKILVEVFNEKELSREVSVSESGEVSLFLLGNVEVAGMTPAEAEAKIERLLKEDYMRNPHVIVTVKEYRRRVVAVTGAVKKPTIVQLPPEQDMTILQAVSAAEGFTDMAKTDRIQVIRQGEQKPIRFSLNELKRATNSQANFSLKAGDTIFVPKRVF